MSSEGSWRSIPNGDCRASGSSLGKITWMRGGSEGCSSSTGKVRFQGGLSRQTGSLSFKERPTDRRLSIPSVSAISPETPTSKQPVKKVRSLSINSSRTLPYIAANYVSLNTNSISRKTAMASSDRRNKGRSDDVTATLYEKNRETLCNDNSVINCTKTSSYLSRGTLTRQESGTPSTVENSPTSELRISRNSDESPFSGTSTCSDQGSITASGESSDNVFAFVTSTTLSNNVSGKPGADQDKGELSHRHDLPDELESSGITSGPVEAPPSPLSSADKKSPHEMLQRPLFPPPTVPDIPTKNSD